jgi:metallophosphoesterase superfamily enzyme
MKERKEIDTLILSDIHFGSELCNAELLLGVMSHFRFRRLILNGDIFDHLNLEFEVKTRHLREGQQPRVKKHRLKKSHLKALSFISGLSKPENDCEVVWIEGNHDEGISHVLSSLIGATVYDEYRW